MRSRDEVQQRIDKWRQTKDQFFPDPYYMAIFDFFVSRLAQMPKDLVTKQEIDEGLWRRLEQIGTELGADKEYMSANREYVARRWKQELGWLGGEEDRGALSRVAWDFLLYELHDAECTFGREGPDLVFDGTGDPPDSVHRGRTFRFWLRVKNGQMRDERSSSLPVEKIWILYHDPIKDEFLFTAQDDTLSGILTFSGDDYEYRLWDHKVP